MGISLTQAGHAFCQKLIITTLPRKLLITYTQELGEPQYVATIDGWNLAPATADVAHALLRAGNVDAVEIFSYLKNNVSLGEVV